MPAKKPNLLFLITDQQRHPIHWPDDPQWQADLMPGDAEIARTGLSFTEACAASCMCSPSRASLFTGRWPAEHGVGLTLTRGGFKPNPRNIPATMKSVVKTARSGEMSWPRAFERFLTGALRRADGGEEENELDPATPNLPRILEKEGYRTYLKGKWHLSQPVNGEDWSEADRDHLAEAYGFRDWQPPDAGENIEPSQFGGGNASGATGKGFDEDFTRDVEAFLADPPPEPWALVVSLVNPHDVLGFPDSWQEGGYLREDWQDLEEIELPASHDENLVGKPSIHSLMKMGQNSFLGALPDDEEKLDYCRFYAHLHRLVDQKVSRVVKALGSPDQSDSLRSRTVIFRTSDHGELSMSHGGLRQKAFNSYEETVNVPLIVSNPVLFPEAVESDAPVSLCDLLPTAAAITGADTSGEGIRGRDLSPILAHHCSLKVGKKSAPADFGAVVDHPEPVASVQDYTHFTYDDHQSASAYRNVAPQPNRIRAVRSRRATYAVYLDHGANEPPEFELYDNLRDPDQMHNLVDVNTGEVKDPADRTLRDEMHAALLGEMQEKGTQRWVPAMPTPR